MNQNDTTPATRRGRPRKPNASTPAERKRASRERIKAEMQDAGYMLVAIPVRKAWWEATQTLAEEFDKPAGTLLAQLASAQLYRAAKYQEADADIRRLLLKANPNFADVYNALHDLPFGS